MSIPDIAQDVALRQYLPMAKSGSATPYDIAIGRRVRHRRERNGWSQDALAARINQHGGRQINGGQIAKIERGEQQVSAEWLYRLADGLECHTLDLLYDLDYGESLDVKIRELGEADRDAVTRIVDTLTRAPSPDEPVPLQQNSAMPTPPKPAAALRRKRGRPPKIKPPI